MVKIWVLDDGETWTDIEPVALELTEEQADVFRSGEGVSDLLDDLLGGGNDGE